MDAKTGSMKHLATWFGACIALAMLVSASAAFLAPSKAEAIYGVTEVIYCYDGFADDVGIYKEYETEMPGPPISQGAIYAELQEHIEGWYYNDARTKPVKEGDLVPAAEELRLYAKWLPVTVTYNYGGVKQNEQASQFLHTAVYDPLTDEAPEGFVHDAAYDEHILGWYLDAACENPCVMADGLQKYEDTTLYAKWDTKIEYYFGPGIKSIVKDWNLTEPPVKDFVAGWRISDQYGTPCPFDYTQPTVVIRPDEDHHYEASIKVNAQWDTDAIGKMIFHKDILSEALTYLYYDEDAKAMATDTKNDIWALSSNYHPTTWSDGALLPSSYLSSPGWYVVTENVTYDQAITVKGDVHLILMNGCTLTANKGISVEENNSLTIYAQTEDTEVMGGLTAISTTDGRPGIGGKDWFSPGSKAKAGDITINGGNISATGANGGTRVGGAAGIGGGYMGWPGLITINGGNVVAKGGKNSAGIGAAEAGRNSNKSVITINGGTIHATSGGGGAGAIGAPGASSTGPHKYTIHVAGGMFVRVGKSEPESTVSDLSQAEKRLNNSGFAWVTERSNFAEGDLHTVTFVTEGTEPVLSQDVEKNGRLVPPDPVIPGATSVTSQWFKDSALTQEWDAANDRVNEDMTLYATWTYYVAAVNPTCVTPGAKEYWCVDGVFYADANFQQEIADLAAWKAEGGEGYLAPLNHPDENADGVCDVCKGVIYISPDGQKTVAKDCKALDANTKELNGGEAGKFFYVAPSKDGQELALAEPLVVKGEVTLILSDGAILNAAKGIVLNGGSHLTLLAQSVSDEATAFVSATGERGAAGIGADFNSDAAGDLDIYGGTIVATGGKGAAGIGAGALSDDAGTVTIHGEEVYVMAGTEKPDTHISSKKYMADHSARYVRIGYIGGGVIPVGILTADDPVVNEDLVYTGQKLVGVDGGEGFLLKGNVATEVGTYQATAQLEYGYMWSDLTADDRVLTWTIAQQPLSASRVKLSGTAYAYNGNAKKPSVTVTNSAGSVLVQGTDYTVKYAAGRKYVGSYKVTITGMGNYSGTVEKTFKVNPKKSVVKSVTPGAKKLTVKMSYTAKSRTGQTKTYYQVAYKQKGTSKWKYASGTAKQVKTISKLKKGKQYYVKVRAYKTVNSKKYYGAWSKTKLSGKVK